MPEITVSQDRPLGAFSAPLVILPSLRKTILTSCSGTFLQYTQKIFDLKEKEICVVKNGSPQRWR